MICAVIFDMDGLLIDSDALWWEALRDVFQPLGIELSDERLRYQAGRRINKNIEELYHMHSWSGPSPQEVEEQILNAMINHIKKEVILLPGAKKVLEACDRTGLPMAIASSSAVRVIEAVVSKLSL